MEFQELSQIEGAMLGKVQVRKKGNTIYVKREIPAISRAPETLKKDGEKKFIPKRFVCCAQVPFCLR
ncbi:hypothetical protein LEP1GSC133_1653 [Leptospira borgpetersenii serovar Pomona str. 200901868]|uniref:Uncharacterized protein n=1 Tax=Leptospira borgpetersenii serovar Pomona str. 200901868 TaxID=1192866 RepID=M6WL34_LEPBO|nr:hypothetical protein LEP1GSC133_1653 [Leptospira borgpetersenii serovar Pomona str. 200901868]